MIFFNVLFVQSSTDFHSLKSLSWKVFENVFWAGMPREFGTIENIDIVGLLAAPLAATRHW